MRVTRYSKIYNLLALIFLALITVPAAYATPTVCNSGSEGVIVYNVDHKIMQFCNGTQWMGMGASLGGGAGSSVWVDGGSGKIYYNGGNVGVGTATPTSKLHVVTSAGGTGIVATDSTYGTAAIKFSNAFGVGIGNIGAGPLALLTSDLSRVFISTTGNVGVGTTLPKTKLHVSDSTQSPTIPALGASSNTQSYLTNVDNAYGLLSGVLSNGKSWLQSQRTDGTATAYELLLNPNGGNVGIGTASPTHNLTVNGQLAIESGHILTTNMNGALVFNAPDVAGDADGIWFRKNLTLGNVSSYVDLMRIDTSGNFGIGATSPSGKLHVNGPIYFQNIASASSGYYLCQDSVNNQITRGGSCSLSDIRLKKNINPIQNALNDLSAMQGVRFDWKDTERAKRDGNQIGLIAQDVETVYPEAVLDNGDGTKGLNYDALMGPVIEAIKELHSENKRLRSDFEAYKAAHP